MTRYKFLSPEVLDEAAEELYELADKDGVDVALIGGRALQLYGSTRLTGDVDFAAYEPFGDLRNEGPLTMGGFKTHTSNGTPADIVICDDDFASLYEEAVEKAVLLEGYDVPVATLEHITAIKMVANRGKDNLDFNWIVTESDVDLKKAREIVKRHLGAFAAKEFDLDVEEAVWKASRGR